MKTISLVIVCYNEEKRIVNIFERLNGLKLFRGFRFSEVIFVDNGSSDKTLERISITAQNYPKFLTSIVSYKKKLAKSAAIKEGTKVSASDINVILSPALSDLEIRGGKLVDLKNSKGKPNADLLIILNPESLRNQKVNFATGPKYYGKVNKEVQ